MSGDDDDDDDFGYWSERMPCPICHGQVLVRDTEVLAVHCRPTTTAICPGSLTRVHEPEPYVW